MYNKVAKLLICTRRPNNYSGKTLLRLTNCKSVFILERERQSAKNDYKRYTTANGLQARDTNLENRHISAKEGRKISPIAYAIPMKKRFQLSNSSTPS